MTVPWVEIIGDVTGAACVVLVARQNIWNWPLGLVNNVFWAVVFWQAKLYSDSTLQGVFFLLGSYGWWRWQTAPKVGPVLPVRRTKVREWVALAVVGALATTLSSLWLAAKTDSPAPVADASVLTLSLIATWGQAEKVVESWWVWIVVDLISVPLYVSRGLYPTAVVYVGFGILCGFGLRGWMTTLRAQAPA